MADREVRVAIVGDPSSLQRALRQSTSGVESFQSKMQNVSRRMMSIGSAMTASITLPFIALGAVGVRELRDAEEALAQTRAAIRSTGGAAGKTSDDIVQLSQDLSEMSSVDDEDIQALANTLLTFRNIAGPTFDEATTAALDLSAAMGTDLHAAAIQVGKAVNDPVRGLTALTRVGVTFSDTQREAITAMVAFGDTAGAQRIILEELNAEFGGSAEAFGGTLSGRIQTAQNRFEELSATITADLVPIIESLAGWIETLAGWFDSLTPTQQKWVSGLILAAAVAGPLIAIIGGVAAGLAAIGLTAGLVIVAIAALAAGVYYAYTNWGWFRTGVDAAWQALQVVWDVILAVGRAAASAIGQMIHWIDNVIQKLREWFNATRPIREALVRIGQVTFGALESAIRGVLGVLGEVVDKVSQAIGLFRTLANIGGSGSDLTARANQRAGIDESASFIPSSTGGAGNVLIAPIDAGVIERAMTRALERTISPVVVIGSN